MRESAADSWPARCAKFPESFSQPADINIVCHNYLLKYAGQINSSAQVKVLLVSADVCRTVQSVRCLEYAFLSSAAFNISAGIHPERVWDSFPRNTAVGTWNFPTHCRLVLRFRTAEVVNVTSFRWYITRSLSIEMRYGSAIPWKWWDSKNKILFLFFNP